MRDAEDMIPAEFRAVGLQGLRPRRTSWADVVEAWDDDEFALDPTRITLVCGDAGFDGTQFKGLLAERFDIQINKTSRNSVLVQTNINNTHSDVGPADQGAGRHVARDRAAPRRRRRGRKRRASTRASSR